MPIRPMEFVSAIALVALTSCTGASPSAIPSPSTSTSSSAAASSPASATQTPRTLTFPLNPLTGHEEHGTVVIEISGNGYTMTVTVEGLDPNTRHIINSHDSSCAALVPTEEFFRTDVRADANGEVVSVSQFPTAYLIPAAGRVLTVHGNGGTNDELAHIACADLTN